MKNLASKKLFTIAICGAAVACVKQVWQVSYSYENNKSIYSEDLVRGLDGSLYIAGLTNEGTTPSNNDGIFVTKFNASGNVMWGRLIPGKQMFLMQKFASGEILATNSKNHVFFAWGNGALEPNVPIDLHLYELDENGALISDKIALTGNSWAAVDDLKVGTDDTVYLSMNNGSYIKAFSSSGDLLWQIIPNEQSVLSAESKQSSLEAIPARAKNWGPGGTMALMQDGKLVHGLESKIEVIDSNGIITATVNARDLGFLSFSMPQIVRGKIVILGMTASQVTTLEFDDNLNVNKSYLVSDFNGFAGFSATDHGLCVVSAGYSLKPSGGNTVTIFNADGAVISQEEVPIPIGSSWEVVDIVSNPSSCAISESYTDPDGIVTSRVTTYPENGSPGKVIQQKNATIDDLLATKATIIRLSNGRPYNSAFTGVQLSSDLIN